nr:447_t:CDS:2 [Entrophospora candida]
MPQRGPYSLKGCIECRKNKKKCEETDDDERCKACKLKNRTCNRDWNQKKRGRKRKIDNNTTNNHQLDENTINFFRGMKYPLEIDPSDSGYNNNNNNGNERFYTGYNDYKFEFDPSLPSDSEDPFSNNPIT